MNATARPCADGDALEDAELGAARRAPRRPLVDTTGWPRSAARRARSAGSAAGQDLVGLRVQRGQRRRRAGEARAHLRERELDEGSRACGELPSCSSPTSSSASTASGDDSR